VAESVREKEEEGVTEGGLGDCVMGVAVDGVAERGVAVDGDTDRESVGVVDMVGEEMVASDGLQDGVPEGVTDGVTLPRKLRVSVLVGLAVAVLVGLLVPTDNDSLGVRVVLPLHENETVRY